jgi:hypothetical protein
MNSIITLKSLGGVVLQMVMILERARAEFFLSFLQGASLRQKEQHLRSFHRIMF